MVSVPKFSVIIPVYNREQTIKTAIESVLHQTYRDFELVVCDDGSTDGTRRILESFGANIQIVSTHREGPGGARNAAAAVARGEFLSCLDSDDLWPVWTLEVASQICSNDSQVKFIFGKEARFVDGPPHADQELFSGERFDYLHEAWGRGSQRGGAAFTAIHRETFRRYGGFSPGLYCGEDWDLVYRMSGEGAAVCVKSPIMFFGRWSGNRVSDNPQRLCEAADRIFRMTKEGAYRNIISDKCAPFRVAASMLTSAGVHRDPKWRPFYRQLAAGAMIRADHPREMGLWAIRWVASMLPPIRGPR